MLSPSFLFPVGVEDIFEQSISYKNCSLMEGAIHAGRRFITHSAICMHTKQSHHEIFEKFAVMGCNLSCTKFHIISVFQMKIGKRLMNV
jgi:hypothetical protein